jgi:hypothetical protein
MKIQTFIFNWQGQYEKTKEKQTQLSAIGVVPVVINSDDNHREDDPNWHNIGEESYFTAQFLKAIELFDADVMFHIQADASYSDWKKLYDDAEKYYDVTDWGIYAPNVDYTWYDSTRTDDTIEHPRGTNYNTDQAEQEMWHLYNSLTPDVKEAFGLIKNNKDGLSKYYT